MMNKCVRRVPLEFDWPAGEKWEGFVNPHNKHFVVCERCEGLAVSKEARALEDVWYGRQAPEYDRKTGLIDFGKIECEYGFIYHFTRRIHHPEGLFYRTMQRRSYEGWRARWKPKKGYLTAAPPLFEKWLREYATDPMLFLKMHSAWMLMLDDADTTALYEHGALRHLTHDWHEGEWVAKQPKVVPTAEQVNLYMHDEGYHDSFISWIVIEAFCRRNNLAYTCPHCQGRGGHFPDETTRIAARSWTPYDPPVGEGYQFWDPGQDGAPLSPVFSDPKELVAWLVKQGLRLNRRVDITKTLKWVQSDGTKGLSSTEFIWLYRDYRITQNQTFHPTLVPELAYQ
jgi:hypothetical protein